MTLHEFTEDENLPKMEELLNKGAQIDALDDLDGWTPLMRAARFGKREAARLLVRRGAKLNIQSQRFKNTALHLAACDGHFEVVHDLAEPGADLTVKDCDGKFAFDLAKQKGKHEIAKFLKNLMKNSKPISAKLDETKTQIEGEMESLRSAVQKQSCKIDYLEAVTIQQNSHIVCLQNNFERLQKDLNCATRANLELAKLIAGEPSDEALKILNNAFDKYPIKFDFSITSSSAKEVQELLEAPKFGKKMKKKQRRIGKIACRTTANARSA